MREIKLRVWDEIYKRMEEVRDIDFQRKRYQRFGSVHDTEWKYYKNLIQYTGLKIRNTEIFDGDVVSCLEVWINKHNKEIIESNPVYLQVCFQNYEWVFVGRVFVDDGSNMVRLKFPDYHEDMSWGEGFEIYNGDFQAITRYMDFKCIGNIYENPELFQEKSQ